MSEKNAKLVNVYTAGKTAEHARFLYMLLAQRPPIANISHRQMPTWKEHLAFMVSKPYAAWFIVMVGDEMAGSVYLTRQAEIGIHVPQRAAGKGLGKWAVCELMRKNPVPMFYANISPRNDRSITMFQKLGFKPHSSNSVQITFCREGAK